MDAFEPRIRVLHQGCAPKTYPCPHCGKTGRRKQVHTRRIRDIAYREVLFIDIEIGEYRARCAGEGGDAGARVLGGADWRRDRAAGVAGALAAVGDGSVGGAMASTRPPQDVAQDAPQEPLFTPTR